MNKEKVSRISGGAWPLTVLALICVIAFRKVLFSGFMSITLTDDTYHMFYAWSYYFVDAVKKGVFPMWNYMTLCGHPFGVDPPTNINILNMLAVFFGPKLAWTIRHIGCMFFAGYFTYLYARLIKVSKFSSLVSGTIYMFMFTVLGDHLHTVSFFIPLIFICLEKAVCEKRNKWVAFAAILMALHYFNSNPQYSLYIFIFASCYVIFRNYDISGKFEFGTVSRFLIIFAFLTFGFSSIQVFRMYEVAKDSQRAASFHTSAYSFLLPTHLITSIMPYFYNSPFRPDELNFFFGRTWIEVVKKLPPVFGKPGLIYAPYVGMLPLMLGILAFVKRRKKGIEKFFGWSALITLFLMATSFIWHIVVRHVPLLNQMHQVQRMFIIYEFSLPVLAGIGLDFILNSGKDLSWRRILGKVSLIFSIVVIGIIGLFSIIHICILKNKDVFFDFGNKFLNEQVLGNPQFVAPAALYQQRLNELYQLLYSWTDIIDPSYLIPLAVLSLCISALYLFMKNLISRRVFCFFVAIILISDLFIISNTYLFFTPNKEVAPITEETEFLKKQPGLFRVFRLQDERNYLKPMEPGSFLKPNTNLFYGISGIEGWKPLTFRRYSRFMKLIDPEADDSGLTGEFYELDPRIISLMNVKYVVTSYDRDLGAGFGVAYEGPQYRVYENKMVLPRAFMVHKAIVVEGEEEILEVLGDPSFDLDKEIIIEDLSAESLAGASAARSSTAKVKEYGPHKVFIEVDSFEDGYLFLSDCYASGWKVYVDGNLEKIYKADYIFRAVKIPEGHHEVEFIYSPKTVKVAFIFIMVSFFIVAVIVLAEHRKKQIKL